MNLKYMKVSLFEISYKKNELFHVILIYWDAPVYVMNYRKSIPHHIQLQDGLTSLNSCDHIPAPPSP